jgi:GNAT superfamily N-acetyltransferase
MTAPRVPTVRTATHADRAEIVALQRLSLRTLGRQFYSDLEIESYLRHTPTLEEYLLDDATYYVAHVDDRLVACGGWSVRPPAYGSVTSDPFQELHRGLPKVRAMFVHPDFARCGLGRRILAVIEAAIIGAGYDAAAIDATLGGALLYERCGYAPVGEMHAALPDGARMRFVRLHKRLVEASRQDLQR